jgi:hypothetical protein
MTVQPSRRLLQGRIVKLNLQQPSIQYSGRTFIKKISDFLTFLEIDEVLFPDLLRPEVRDTLEGTVKDAKAALVSIRKQLFDISNFLSYGVTYEERMLEYKRKKRMKDRLAKRISREKRRKFLQNLKDKKDVPNVVDEIELTTVQKEMPKLIQIVNCLSPNPIIESLATLSNTLVSSGVYPSTQRINVSANINETDIPEYEPISEADDDLIIDVTTVDDEAIDLSTKSDTQIIKSIRFV